ATAFGASPGAKTTRCCSISCVNLMQLVSSVSARECPGDAIERDPQAFVVGRGSGDVEIGPHESPARRPRRIARWRRHKRRTPCLWIAGAVAIPRTIPENGVVRRERPDPGLDCVLDDMFASPQHRADPGAVFAEYMLRTVGLDAHEAQKVARRPLPPPLVDRASEPRTVPVATTDVVHYCELR